jgi:hypothetical protein
MAELMVQSGTDPQEALMALVPEAYRNHPDLVKNYPEVGGWVGGWVGGCCLVGAGGCWRVLGAGCWRVLGAAGAGGCRPAVGLRADEELPRGGCWRVLSGWVLAGALVDGCWLVGAGGC